MGTPPYMLPGHCAGLFNVRKQYVFTVPKNYLNGNFGSRIAL
jgi:hypothetical protein